MSEPWLEAERRAAAADRRLARRPVCVDCGRHIAGTWCLPLPNGEILCEDCVWQRLVEVSDLP